MGSCAKDCGEALSGAIVKVDGKLFHKDCFTCEMCSDPAAVVVNHVPLCNNHQDSRKAAPEVVRGGGFIANTKAEGEPKLCAKCDKVIQGTTSIFGGRHWHPECMRCHRCGTTISRATGIGEVRGRLICGSCKVAGIHDKIHAGVSGEAPKRGGSSRRKK